MTSLR